MDSMRASLLSKAYISCTSTAADTLLVLVTSPTSPPHSNASRKLLKFISDSKLMCLAKQILAYVSYNYKIMNEIALKCWGTLAHQMSMCTYLISMCGITRACHFSKMAENSLKCYSAYCFTKRTTFCLKLPSL